jgi:hypothetical protein
MSVTRQACLLRLSSARKIKSNHQGGESKEATHDDAVVALRRLDVELVLQQEPGGSNRVAEAAEYLTRERG